MHGGVRALQRLNLILVRKGEKEAPVVVNTTAFDDPPHQTFTNFDAPLACRLNL